MAQALTHATTEGEIDGRPRRRSQDVVAVGSVGCEPARAVIDMAETASGTTPQTPVAHDDRRVFRR